MMIKGRKEKGWENIIDTNNPPIINTNFVMECVPDMEQT